MIDQNEQDRIEAEFIRTTRTSDPFASAVKATRMPMIITDPNKHDNPIIFANAAFLKLTGYEYNEIISKNCRFLQGKDTDQADVALVRDAIARRVPIELDVINYKKNGEKFWNRLLISPVFDDDGSLTYFFASQYDVTLERDKVVRMQREQQELEQQVARQSSDLETSESRMKFILKSARIGSWSLDLTQMKLAASEICKENFGRKADEPFTYEELLGAITPADRGRMLDAVQESIANKIDYEIEYQARTPNGETRWLQIRGKPYYRADGTPLSMAGVSIDITERKRGEAQRALLTDELNHRVKNSMATLQSIAMQTLRSASSLKDAEKTLNERIQSLATAHNVLTRESWEGADLREVVESAIASFRNGSHERFIFGGPRIWLSPRLSLAFVLALHELATNAVKYGSLSNDHGHVILNWDYVDGSSRERIWLQWEEIGGPAVVKPTRTGFGSRMIEKALSLELNGKAEIDYRPSGIVFTVEAPIPPKAIDSMSTATVFD